MRKALRKGRRDWKDDKESIFVVVARFLRPYVTDSERKEAVARLTKLLKKELQLGSDRFSV